MSDDEADPELLELLRQSLGLSRRNEDEISSDTGVLKDAQYIYDNAIDVSIDMFGTKAAATSIYSAMQQRSYSTEAWSQQDLHPTQSDGFSELEIVNFVFTMDLLNFSFWSELSENERFQVDYNDKRWTGYKSLLACLRRALDDGIPITTPRFWTEGKCSDEMLRHVFRSATAEEIPLLQGRMEVLREAGKVLHESFGDPDANEYDETEINGTEAGEATAANERSLADIQPLTEGAETARATVTEIDTRQTEDATESASGTVDENERVVDPNRNLQDGKPPAPNLDITSHLKPDMSVVRLLEKADRSAGKLVNILVKYFPSFRDESRFDGRRVRFFKRAQIFVADLWAAFNGSSYGEFHDIENLTMFADYRVPQMLNSLGVLVYSPPLHYAISDKKKIASGHSWEVQLRGCSIWAVELIRREIMRQHPESTHVNAVLIDFLLYDLAKEREASGKSYTSHLSPLPSSPWYLLDLLSSSSISEPTNAIEPLFRSVLQND